MQSPVQITFRGVPHSDFVEEKIREKAEKLERYFPHITSCHVIVNEENHRHHKGNLYVIHIDINVPDTEIVVSHKNNDNHAHEDAYVAIRDAFDAAKRQLEDYARKRRGETKSHDSSSRGSQAKRYISED